ncbi:MAG: pyridoxal phosphate-dependent aminotransferase [Candidatus Acidiferrales bacterium]
MAITRRDLLGKMGALAAAGAGIHSLASPAQADQWMASISSPSRGPILLNKNENAYGPSKQVLLAIQRGLGLANRFPETACSHLVDEIAGAHGVNSDQIVLGCGSSEVIRAAAAAFLGPGKTLILSSPTFDVISSHALAAGASIVSVPLNRFLANDLDSILGHVNASTGLIYISNPNNPTAILNPRGDLETFIDKLPKNARLIIDEAYHHYAGNSSSYATFLDRSVKDDRLIVTRTFSKAYALAGLRIGYGVCTHQTAREISLHTVSDNINAVGADAAIAALKDSAGLNLNIQRNSDDRQEFLNQAYARMMRPVDSHTNFVMFKTVHHAPDLIEHFQNHGILIGPYYPAYEDYVRVTIGLPEEMKEFWRVWDLLPLVNKMAM